MQNEYPHDAEVRPRKMARTFVDRGYRVVILAERREDQPASEVLEGVGTIHRFPPLEDPPLAGSLATGHPWNLPWAFWIGHAARRENLDLLICGNIGLAIQTGVAGRILDVPVVLDLFENNPGAVSARGKAHWYHHITRNRTLVELLEDWSIGLADRTWVVAEENAERLMRKGISGEDLALVGNTPTLESPETSSRRGGAERFRMVYVGIIYEFRGLDLVVEAMPHLVADDPDVELVIGGDGPHRGALERKASELGVRDHVTFLGWVPAEDVPDVIARSHVGLVPHRVSEHTRTTIPNKLFDYMVSGLPVVSTSLPPVTRILSEWECGCEVSPDDPVQVADTLRELKRNPERAERLGRNGRRAVEMRFNWLVEERTILGEIRGLLDRTGSVPPRRGRPTERELDRSTAGAR